ncbi:MAG: hypothetical protein HY913_06550 [Desulfomonile tiedjei]|nr:hypothetical protein [Desulfomonile tiedjei]
MLWSVKLRDYYTGALSEIAFDFGGALSQISVKLQADAALTKAEAVDNHVQWPYSEIVFDTKGSAWHVSLETRLAVANMAVLGCAVDFERTHTHGHRHTSNPYDRKGWNSEETRIWSDQLWFTIHGELIF